MTDRPLPLIRGHFYLCFMLHVVNPFLFLYSSGPRITPRSRRLPMPLLPCALQVTSIALSRPSFTDSHSLLFFFLSFFLSIVYFRLARTPRYRQNILASSVTSFRFASRWSTCFFFTLTVIVVVVVAFHKHYRASRCTPCCRNLSQ